MMKVTYNADIFSYMWPTEYIAFDVCHLEKAKASLLNKYFFIYKEVFTKMCGSSYDHRKVMSILTY